MCRSLNKENIHINSQVAFAMEQYSTLANDLDTVCCFFDFQETKESLMKTQNPLIDLLVSGQAAQSEFAKAFNSMADEEE